MEILKTNKPPFLEENLEKHLQDATKITFTTDFSTVSTADIVIICVPTPVYENHMPNLKPVIGATEGIAPYLKKGHLVILESTVNPGVSESIVLPILEEKSGLKGGVDFYLAHCPERINPGDKKWNVENINRVVGSFENVGLGMAAAFYESILTGSVKKMESLKEAEAVKVVENSFRDINIAFVNELARSFTKLDIDVVNVIDGAATKPFAFMAHYPGCGVGGHCIPVDPYYLIEYAKENGFNHDFLSLARRINTDMPAFTVEQLQDALNKKQLPLNGTEIAVLGVAYKANIDDCRESPSFEIIRILKEKGAKLRIYDPYVSHKSTVHSLEEALRDAKAVVIATPHDEFKKMTSQELVNYGVEVVMDGRNCLEKVLFNDPLLYIGIGR
ncbi:TPA: UDP-N-acetyl-D-glucosamine dehydrogenase [Patescibacteria group bacterium]|nr:UDP-N-acetyl-D-glucosamine dehydrogenase [Patescibacteria group bacterium]